MKVKDIMHRLFEWTPSERTCGSDMLIYGDNEKDVKKVAVCCIASCDVIKKAKEWGAELIITHEPTFHKAEYEDGVDIVAAQKAKLIEQAGITIYRFHDHAHFTMSDKIIEGVLKKIEWQGCFDGIKKFTLDNVKSVAEIKRDIENRLELKNVRLTGCGDNNNVRNISMCVGAWGEETVMSELRKPDIDMVLCGEITEYSVCEYVRDAGQLGFKKTLLLLGHMGSEKSGMEYICEYLADTIDEIEFKYIDCREVY